MVINGRFRYRFWAAPDQLLTFSFPNFQRQLTEPNGYLKTIFLDTRRHRAVDDQQQKNELSICLFRTGKTNHPAVCPATRSPMRRRWLITSAETGFPNK